MINNQITLADRPVSCDDILAAGVQKREQVIRELQDQNEIRVFGTSSVQTDDKGLKKQMCDALRALTTMLLDQLLVETFGSALMHAHNSSRTRHL